MSSGAFAGKVGERKTPRTTMPTRLNFMDKALEELGTNLSLLKMAIIEAKKTGSQTVSRQITITEPLKNAELHLKGGLKRFELMMGDLNPDICGAELSLLGEQYLSKVERALGMADFQVTLR